MVISVDNHVDAATLMEDARASCQMHGMTPFYLAGRSIPTVSRDQEAVDIPAAEVVSFGFPQARPSVKHLLLLIYVKTSDLIANKFVPISYSMLLLRRRRARWNSSCATTMDHPMKTQLTFHYKRFREQQKRAKA